MPTMMSVTELRTLRLRNHIMAVTAIAPKNAATTDDIILAGLASASRGRLRVVGKPFTQEYYGIGVKKGNTELKNKINNAITDMIQDGSWQRAISDNTRGVAYTPNAKYNPPVPNGKGNK